MINYKSNNELLEALNGLVVGHISAKKALINLVNRSKIRHYQKWIACEHRDFLIAPSKCLMVGDSGTGKTFLVECLQQLVDFPLLKIDATRLTITSAGDGIKSAEIYNMIYDNAKHYEEVNRKKGYTNSIEGLIDQTVVFIDEVDKLAWGANGERDHWNKRTQANFLQIFENYDELAGVSFIFAGAFANLERSKTKGNSIGFCQDFDSISENDILDELIVKYGLIPELVGRITAIVELDTLTEDHYRAVLQDILIPRKLEELIYFNCVDFELSNKDIDVLIKKAMKSGQGIRFLKRELDKLLLDIEFNYENVTNHRLLLHNLIDNYDGTSPEDWDKEEINQ